MADKQQVLADIIAAAVQKQLAPEFKALSEHQQKLSVTLNGVLARLELIEQMPANGAAPAKRAVRTGTAAGSAKKAAGGAGAKPALISNSLLYFRHLLAKDIDGQRAIWGSDENLAFAAGDSTVEKRAKTKDSEPEEYWSAVGAALWKGRLSDTDKEEIKTLYTAYKEAAAREGNEAQLEADEATA